MPCPHALPPLYPPTLSPCGLVPLHPFALAPLNPPNITLMSLHPCAPCHCTLLPLHPHTLAPSCHWAFAVSCAAPSHYYTLVPLNPCVLMPLHPHAPLPLCPSILLTLCACTLMILCPTALPPLCLCTLEPSCSHVHNPINHLVKLSLPGTFLWWRRKFNTDRIRTKRVSIFESLKCSFFYFPGLVVQNFNSLATICCNGKYFLDVCRRIIPA